VTSGRPIDEATRRHVLRLLADTTESARRIARRLGCDRETVSRVMRDAARNWWRYCRAQETASQWVDEAE
jgi:DNA invertase Pin-like site-specific DNA recombinase